MIPFVIGVLILVAIFGFFYFMKSKNPSRTEVETPPIKIETPVKEEDIVLALLTEKDKPSDYAILWNGTPNKTYPYIITHDSLEIAKGEISSPSSVFRVRGIPIVSGKTYDVQVGDRRVKIPFTPPTILGARNREGELDVETNIVPTDIEVIVASNKIPLSECQIKIEPPGFICKIPSTTNPTIMVYNGRNAVNILL